jgi:hypothetical protein
MSFMQLHRAYQKGRESPNWVKVALWFSLYPQAGLIVNAQRTDWFWNLYAKGNFWDNPETKGMLSGRSLRMPNLFILTHLQRWLMFFVVRFITLSCQLSMTVFQFWDNSLFSFIFTSILIQLLSCANDMIVSYC